MTLYRYLLLAVFIFHSVLAISQDYSISSPNGEISIKVNTGQNITWSVNLGKQVVLEPSAISMQLEKEQLGENPKVKKSTTREVNEKIEAINYKKDVIVDHYNELTLTFKGDFGLKFRTYNDGVAYRFFTEKKGEITILSEEAEFNFSNDHKAYIPYANDPTNDAYQISFENNYVHIPLSEMVKDTVAFAPILVELENGVKAAITEADLESYAGMFLRKGKGHSLVGDLAKYPNEEVQGGYNDLQALVINRKNYIAKTSGKRSFPWRVVIISKEDKDLLNNDLVYALASPSRIEDVSWIDPGKVAWDWWNDWNIYNVDFKAGINTETYKYYADFAAEYGIENILLDEGWANSLDIMDVVPEIDIEEIVKYANSKGVGVWLWGGWYPLDNKMDEALSTYSRMGIKGFKVDFMNRDDQKMVDFYYRLSKKAAEYKMMLDFHGAYKPTGLQRTYPNVVNFEGVRGLENVKWSNTDFPLYDTSIPFIRMLAGPLDYTPGAMINANKENFRSIFSTPMSQGTRCHQLAIYVVYESPFNMLADNPTNYMREPESTKFIAAVPTVFDETVALDGKVGEFAAIARRKGDTWFIGALTNWNERELSIDLSFLSDGEYEAVIFKDGVNAARRGEDYQREVIKVKKGEQLKFHMAPGGGWAARIYPVK